MSSHAWSVVQEYVTTASVAMAANTRRLQLTPNPDYKLPWCKGTAHPIDGRPQTDLTPGLEVIKLEYSLRLKIKCNDWLLADTCPQAANHCALFLSLRLYSSFITSRPDKLEVPGSFLLFPG